MRPRWLGGGRVSPSRMRHSRRQTVGPSIMITTVVAGRLNAIASRLRVDEIAALRVGDAGRFQLVPVHSEAVSLLQARPLTSYQ